MGSIGSDAMDQSVEFDPRTDANGGVVWVHCSLDCSEVTGS